MYQKRRGLAIDEERGESSKQVCYIYIYYQNLQGVANLFTTINSSDSYIAVNIMVTVNLCLIHLYHRCLKPNNRRLIF